MATKDPYLTNLSSSQKDPFLVSLSETSRPEANQQTVQNPDTGASYDLGNIFRMLDINEAGPSAENSERQMAFENYLKGTVLEHASEGKVFDARKRNEDALLISAYTGRDQKDVLDNYDQYVKFFTGNNPGKGVLGAFRDYFDGYYMQKQISNAELALLDIPYDDPRREYYENNLETMRTNHQLKTSDVSNNSEFWRKVASSGNIFAQTAEQLNRTLLASAVFGAIGGAVAPQLGVGMDNLVKAQSIKDAMKLGQSVNMLTYTICEMGKAEAAEVASEASRMVDENGNRIPLEVIKEIAYPIGVISALTEIMDDALTPIGEYKLGKRTLGETAKYIESLIKSNPLGYVGLGVAGTTFQALQEGLQSRIRRLGIDLIVAKSNNQGRTNLPVGNTPEDSLAKWGEALTEFKDSFIPMGVSQLLTGGLSIGATYTTAALSKAMQISPKMRQDASKYFTENGKVYDIGYIDTVGQSPVNIYEPKADKDGKTAEQKRTAPILMYVNKYTGALVPVYTRDRQYVEYLRENGVTGIKGVVISEEALTSAGDNASASNLASILAMRIGADSPVMGYDGSTIIMDSQEGVEAAIEDIESYKDSLSQNVEFEKQEDGSYRIVWENTRGTSQTITVRAKTESDQMVSQNTEAEEATGNVRPVRTMNGEAMNGLFNSTIRKSKDQTLNDAELEMSAKYFYQQLTGLKADEIENLWENDYQAIAEKLPEGVDENTIEQGARFMPLLSSITGRSTEDLLNDPQNRIVLKYLGKAKKARYASGEEGYIAGALNQYKEEDGTNVFEIGLSDIASQTGTELVHELMHVARALAPVERLSGFVGLRGYTGKYGGMWRSDIRQTADGRYRLGARLYDTYEEAAALVEKNEEQFVRDFFEYLRTGEAPNAEVASFFGRLKQFLQSFAREFSKDFSDDTRRAFDMLLNGEVDIQPGQTLEEAVEDSERTLTDDVEIEPNDYSEEEGLDEEGNPLWSLSPEAQRQYDEVVAKYKGTDQWMKAPNGKPTNLTERQWVQVRTLNFKKWFGDWINDPQNASKVVDENGEPLIVYHGTEDVFDVFNPNIIKNGKELGYGSYFTKDRLQASVYGDVGAYFLNIRNPFSSDKIDFETKEFSNVDEAQQLFDEKVKEYNDKAGGYNRFFPIADEKNGIYSVSYATSYKNDADETNDGKIAGNVYVVYSPNQIKSATRNNGEFSSGNDSILYSLAENRQWQIMDANTQRRIDADYEFTRNQYFGTDKWMKAPNGQPTKLTERQWVIVRTPAFKAWFGDWENDPENASRVIDENGEPKVVYHGTNMAGFETFQSGDFGVFFTDDVDVARSYVYENRENPNPDRSFVRFDMTSDAEDERLLSGSIYAVFLNMRDPVTYDAKGNPWYDIMGKGVEGVSPDMNDNEESVAAYAAEYSYDENPDNDGTIVQNVRDYGSGDDATVVKPSTVYVIPWGSENQIKSVDNVGTFSGESENVLYSLTPAQETRALQELDSFPEDERNRIAANFKRLAGTPWHREAMKALVLRNEIETLMEGRELPADSILAQPEYAKPFRKQIKALKGGLDGIFSYLEKASFIANPQKCVYAINSSLLNCNPSLECAKFCYASEGNYVYWQGILKSEIVTKAVESDPERAAKVIARQYKATPDYMDGATLRVFDKGDFSEQYVTLVKELNKNDIAVQVFSNRPEFLKQIDNGINVAMLSIDKSNRFLADENPDLAIAMVYTGRVDINFIEANAKRYEDHGGVILPVKLGTRILSQEELKALPQWARTKYTCPIDAGTKKLGEWNCKKCDINGTGGCFYKNTAASRKYKIYASLQDMDVEAIDEGTRKIAKVLEELGISPDSGEFRRILENLSRIKSETLAGIDLETERTGLQGNGEDSTGGDRAGELAVEENNRNVEEFAKSNNLSSSELYSLDGVLYAKSDPDYDYSEENLRSVKDGISKQLELFDGSDFSSQPDLPFDGESAAGNNRRFSRVLRPGLAKYFSFEKGWNGQEPTIPSINQQWNNLGYIDFTKIRITGASDIAKIWSIYRNPKAEYQHIVFTKGDEIVASLAFSSGLIGCTVASLSEDKAKSFEMLKERMIKYGADGYWLLHNHPSGGVNPSGADRAMTNDYKMAVPGFKGHIILDHNKYTLLKGPFDDETFTLPEGGFHETGNPLPSGAIEFGPNANPEYIALAYSHMRNSGTNIVFIGRHGNDCFIAPEMTIRYNKKGYAYNAYDIIDNPKAREATYAVIVTDSWARYKRVVDEYNKEGVKTVDDVIFVGASGVYYSAFENGDLTVQMTRPAGSRIAFQDTMFVYDRNRKIGLGIDAYAPVMETGNSTLFSLSPEKQSEILQSRKNEIQRAVEAGIFVSTEYLEEFRGEDWVESELDFRDWMKENADIVTMAREADSFEQFKTRYEKKDDSEEDADIPFSENGIFDTEEEQEKYEDWLRKIYHYANALSLQDRDRRFAEEWTSSEDKTLELAKYLRSYMDAAWNPKPKSRSGGYWYTKNVYNSFKGVSQKVRMLYDGNGGSIRNAMKKRASSEQIKEAQELIRQNPRPYRNAYMQAMLGESRASDVQMGLRNIGESADWMKLDMIDDDIAQEIEKIESEETAKKASGVDYKTDSQTLVQKRNDAETDLKKSGESTSSTAKDLKEKLASAEQRIRELEADIKNAESEVDEIIGRMGERIEDLEEKAGKNAALKRQLADRRARVKKLRRELSAANKEKTRLNNALNALRRWKEAKEEMDYRKKRIRQIRRLATFNDATLDAMFEDTFDWVAALFDRDEADMDRRKDLDQRISDLKHEIERAETGGEDASQMREALRRLQNQKKQSRILEPPAQLQRYLPRNYSVRADNRPSMWTSQELDTLLKAVQLMRMDAKAILQDKKNQRMATLMGTAYSYFQQSLGYEAPYDDYGEMSARALGEEVANLPDKTFGTAKEKYLSYHLYKLKIQRLARIIDGYKEGVAYNWFVRRNWKCQTEELKGTNERLDLGEAKWKELELRRGDLSKEGFKSTKLNGTEYSLTRGQMIGVYVYAQSDLGYEKLTSVYGNAIREEDVKIIISQLSDKEKAWADFMLEEMQNNYPRLSKVYYNVWNRNLGQRPAYFPLVSSEARTIDQKDADFLCAQVNGKDGKAYVDKGFTKDVNPNAIYPLKLDVTATWNQQVRRQEHFIAYGEWSRDTQYLMDRGQMGDTIAKAYGPQYRKTLQKMVDHVISNTITTGTDFDRTITKYFSARNAAALTASVSTALKQLGSIGAIFENEGDIGKLLVNENYLRNFLKANAELNAEYGDVKDVREFIYANAPDIRNRQIDFEVMAYLNRVYGGAVSNTIQQATGKIMKYTTNLMDRLVVERLWLARYYTEFEAQKEAGKTVRQAHEEAVFKASQLISETQPTSMRMDQSAQQIEAQKSSLLRMVSVFTNQAMNLSNMIMADWNYARKNRDWKKVVRVTSAVLINAVSVALISGRFIKKGDEDDEKYRWRLAREILGTVAQLADPVWGGNLLQGLTSAFGGSNYLNEFTDLGSVIRVLTTPTDRKTAWEKIADALEDIAGEVLNVMGIPGSNLLRKPVKAIQEKNAGYLLNSAWGQIIESYR